MESVARCPVCRRPVGPAGGTCTACERRIADPADPSPEAMTKAGSRAAAVRVQADCACATYAGVKVHAVTCPEARARA